VFEFAPKATRVEGFTPRFSCYALAPGAEHGPSFAFVRSPGSDESAVLAALKAGLATSRVMPGAPLVVVDLKEGPRADRYALEAMRRIASETIKAVQRRQCTS